MIETRGSSKYCKSQEYYPACENDKTCIFWTVTFRKLIFETVSFGCKPSIWTGKFKIRPTALQRKQEVRLHLNEPGTEIHVRKISDWSKKK